MNKHPKPIWLTALLILFVSYMGLTQAQTITLATSKSIPPYIIKDQQSGIQLDIIKQAFSNAGYQVQQVIFTSNLRAERMLEQNAVDAIVNAPNNGTHAHLSEPVIFYQNVAISLSVRQLNIQSIDDLTKFRLMAFQNAKKYLGEHFAKATEQAKFYTEVANQSAQLERLYRGQVDVIVLDKRIFHYLNQQLIAKQRPTAPVTKHLIFPESPRLLGFHDPELRDKFNAGLKQLNDQKVKHSE
ncbi:transporter substrate-binding domain-containing protein [Agarivorans sp. B2Z047]|uniref:substrate-binding periplasmic protein n=1 Tax=Agarivorans sp. B2Z047 TaxID=2652721 RepID=UPI00128B35A6|nr:transporter substrate-binding domain-containing protein [Agarivorans sp. B2Z047]MPW29163.1 transporter substrate-binding domain-containing protein [Agarivorans sp. B2Z047]UQN41716.1 transporter substrate-binding domain-containing protein [Agarivorans sp. B2Z047]